MFEIYKKGQGISARWIAAAALGALAVFGCYALQGLVSGYTSANLNLGIAQFPVSVLVSAVAFVVAGVLVALVVNHKRLVDYLISSELELRKVSWPTRAELKRQTTVVIVTIFVFSAMLLVADIIFGFASRRLYGF